MPRHKVLRSLVLSAAIITAGYASTGFADPQKHPTRIAEQKAPAPATIARPALWKLTDSDTTIYLFGTIHALPAGISWLEGPIAKALGSSQTLVTEIPEADPATMQAVVMKTAVLPKGQSLSAMLTPKARVNLGKAFKDNGLPGAAFDHFEPWFVAVTLSTMPMLKQGYSAENGVEVQLTKRAKTQGQSLIGLETVEYQLGLFDSLSQKVQINYLNDVVATLPKMGAELDKLVSHWSAGRPDKLAQVMNANEDDPQLIALLLTNRNKNWANWIKTRMDKPGTVFLAVGAGHLAGKGSVQAQLAARGFKTVRVQ